VRQVFRGAKPGPAVLSRRDATQSTELDRVRMHMAAPLLPNTERKAFPFSAYKAEDVKTRLEELFFGKCAYCESYYAAQAPVDVEHFRPKGRVADAPNHPGYWWLAAEWTNLLPSCLDCNRRRKQGTPVVSGSLQVLYETMQTGKQDCFPVEGSRAQPEENDFTRERGLLLDPARDDPDEHLVYWLGDDRAAGLVFPAPVQAGRPAAPPIPLRDPDLARVGAHAAAAGVSVRGAVSIQVYGLNRLHLVQERAKLLQQLRFLESVLLEVIDVREGLEAVNATLGRKELTEAMKKLSNLERRVLDQMRGLAAPDAPHSAIAKAFLRDFKQRLAATQIGGQIPAI